jgi:hypothetical protein
LAGVLEVPIGESVGERCTVGEHSEVGGGLNGVLGSFQPFLGSGRGATDAEGDGGGIINAIDGDRGAAGDGIDGNDAANFLDGGAQFGMALAVFGIGLEDKSSRMLAAGWRLAGEGLNLASSRSRSKRATSSMRPVK